MHKKTILFDVDGVLLSEERFFDATALTIFELIHNELYLGQQSKKFTTTPSETQIRQIRKDVFVDDSVLSFIKSRGINSNWDMAYLVFSYQLLLLLEQIHQKDSSFVTSLLEKDLTFDDFTKIKNKSNALHLSFQPNYQQFLDDFKESKKEKQALFLHLNTIIKKRLSIHTSFFKRRSMLWDICQETFQEWYLGDKYVEESMINKPRASGKKGFLQDEIPILSKEEMYTLFTTLKQKGYQLGIGTGRPKIETIEPLKSLDILPFFDPNRIITASDVLEAERLYPDKTPLAKPEPYSYVQGMLSTEVTVLDAISYPLPIKNGEDVLIVGDSLADYMAAKAIGCQFAAVLTGLSGEKARTDFENRAVYILNNAYELIKIVSSNITH